MFYMADSALWSENESSEYLNHITSINTHKTPKPRKPLLWNKFDNRQQKNKGALAETPRSPPSPQNLGKSEFAATAITMLHLKHITHSPKPSEKTSPLPPRAFTAGQWHEVWKRKEFPTGEWIFWGD